MCKPWKLRRSPFQPHSDNGLYHPADLPSVLDRLASCDRVSGTLFSHCPPFIIDVNSLQHKTVLPYMHHIIQRYTDPPQQRSLGGRKDVFLPYDYPSRTTTTYEDQAADSDGEEPLTPVEYEVHPGERPINGTAQPMELSTAPDSWMDDVAAQEQAAYANERSAVKFYSHSVVGSQTMSASDRNPPQDVLDAPVVTHSPDPLMLYRTPPPWSDLPSCPPSPPKGKDKMHTSVFNSSSSFSSSTTEPLKRKNSTESIQGEQARKRLLALSSIQSMFNMVQKRAEAQPGGDIGRTAPGTRAASASSNPFARSAQAGRSVVMLTARTKRPRSPTPDGEPPDTSTPSLRSIVSHDKAKAPQTPLPTSSKPPTSATSSTGSLIPAKRPAPSVSEASKTESAQAPRPAKKLVPISSLPVPPWPTSHLKPITAHRPKPVVLAKIQTTLPVSVEKVQRRVSAPVPVTKPLEMVPERIEKGQKGKEKADALQRSKEPAAGTGKRRRTSGSRGFDWKGWSAG